MFKHIRIRFNFSKTKDFMFQRLISEHMQRPASKCAISEKNPKNFGKFLIHHFTLGNFWESKLNLWILNIVVWHPLEIPRWKMKDQDRWKFHMALFFLDHCWKFHFLKLTPGISKCSSFNTPGKFDIFNTHPPVWIFSGITQCRPEF